MKILHCATRFLSGGSERDLAACVRGLSRLGATQDLAVGHDADVEAIRRVMPEIRAVYAVSSLRRTPHPVRDAVAIARLTSIVRRGGYDAVHTIQSKSGILGRVAATLGGARIRVHTITMANFGGAFGLPGHLYWLAERGLGPRTTSYTIVGADLAARYASAGLAARTTEVIRSPIPPAKFQDTRSSRAQHRSAMQLPEDAVILLYVGSLEARKNVAALPEVLAEVTRSLPGVDVRLLVAGAGPDEAALRREIDRLRLASRVQLLGHVKDVAPLFGASDVLLLLSQTEGLPQVLVQAAMAGLPFVSSPVDGARELQVLGAAGWIVDHPRSAPSAVLKALQHSGTAPLDDGLVAEWDPAVVEQRYADHFSLVCPPAKYGA